MEYKSIDDINKIGNRLITRKRVFWLIVLGLVAFGGFNMIDLGGTPTPHQDLANKAAQTLGSCVYWKQKGSNTKYTFETGGNNQYYELNANNIINHKADRTWFTTPIVSIGHEFNTDKFPVALNMQVVAVNKASVMEQYALEIHDPKHITLYSMNKKFIKYATTDNKKGLSTLAQNFTCVQS